MKHYKFENAAICLVGSNAAREFLEPIFTERDRELLVVALCDEQVRLMQLLSYPGSASDVQVSLAGIIRQAVVIGCAGMVVAHNHPSGETQPSPNDLALTRRLLAAAESIDIVLLDHLIFNGGPPFSFRRAGLI